MSSIGADSTTRNLLSLPRPLHNDSAGYHFADVWSGMGPSRKRKRAEIAVGIDGEAINIYDLETPRLVTSHALSPVSSFTCAPCTLRLKASTTVASQRLTYISLAGPKHQLVCYADLKPESGKQPSTSPITPSTVFKHDLPHSEHPVVYLDVLPVSLKDQKPRVPADLLTVRQDGMIQSYSGDLHEERWQASLGAVLGSSSADADASAYKVEYVASTDATIARRGLLAGREDVLSLLDSHVTTPKRPSSPLLILMTTKSADKKSVKTGRQLHLLTVRSKRGLSSNTGHGALQCLLSWDLPASAGVLSTSSRPVLHAASGTFQFILNGALHTWNLTASLPKLLPPLTLDKQPPASFLRVSNSVVLTANGASATMYDIHYQSVAASFRIALPHSKTARKKRKVAQAVASPLPSSVRLLSYDARSGVATAIAGDQLLGIEIDFQATVNRSSKRKAGGSLLDAMGHGLRAGDINRKPNLGLDQLPNALTKLFSLPCAAKESVWKERKQKLTQYAAEGNIESFEREFEQLVSDFDASSRPRKRAKSSLEKQSHQMDPDTGSTTRVSNGVGLEATLNADTNTLEPIFDQRVPLLVLRSLFTTVGDENAGVSGTRVSAGRRLEVAFFPPKVFDWLLLSGNFSMPNIQKALRQDSSSHTASFSIEAEEVIRSLMVLDPQAHVLLLVLESPCYLGADEVVQAINILMESLGFLGDPTEAAPLAITENGDKDMADDDAMEIEGEAAEEELEHAVALLDDGDNARDQALSRALLRLHSFPIPTVTAALKRNTSRAGVISLIQMFRNELARDGWLSACLNDDLAVSAEDEAPDQSIKLIGDLLTCALDSVGISGWVGYSLAFDVTDGAAEIINVLKAEVATTLEGVEDALQAANLLGQVLRYGKSASAVRSQAAAKTTTDNGHIIVRTGPVEDQMLPLGLKVEQDISRTKVGAGGEIQKRSARDVGRLKSMRVGKYSVESIVI
ncbi:MAG: hypothetical protein M1817_005790 [Caeruleum heppii]|nr:MAG: hypothetical protein M1817_005790 [Caeruleum heppii]